MRHKCYPQKEIVRDVQSYLKAKGYKVNLKSISLIMDALKEIYLTRLLLHEDKTINILDIVRIDKLITEGKLYFNFKNKRKEYHAPRFKPKAKVTLPIEKYFKAKKIDEKDIEKHEENCYNYQSTNYDLNYPCKDRLR